VNAKRLLTSLAVGLLTLAALPGCARSTSETAEPATSPGQVVVAPHAVAAPTGPTNVVFLGDSYAQGWGLLEADELRAAHWPNAVNHARTGVATWEMAEQLDTLRSQIAAGLVPDGVVLIVGGNDLDLVEAVRQCLAGVCPSPEAMAPRLVELEPNLVARYQQVDELVNSDALVSARGGKRAPVLVGNYPVLLSTAGPINIGPLTISLDNIERINQVITELNASVARSAKAAGGAVQLVDLSAAFDGHRFGDPVPYLSINGHPNNAGYQAILTAFAEALAEN